MGGRLISQTYKPILQNEEDHGRGGLVLRREGSRHHGGAGDPDLWAETVTDEEKDEALDHVLALLDLFTAAKEPELVELCEEVRDRLDGML